jgi:hypothetical protein
MSSKAINNIFYAQAVNLGQSTSWLGRIDAHHNEDCIRITRKQARTIPGTVRLAYDGTADFDAFEQWTFEVNNWFEMTNFSNQFRVRHIKKVMKGKAAKFHMTFVAQVNAYTVESLGRELFDFCFPEVQTQFVVSCKDRNEPGL